MSSPSQSKSRSRNSGKKNELKDVSKEERLNDEDLELLEQICSSVNYDEISFETWCDQHDSLNLIVNAVLSNSEAKAGCKKNVSWTRKIITRLQDGSLREKKERISRDIEFPPNTIAGDTKELSDLGDVKKNQIGNVRVIVKII